MNNKKIVCFDIDGTLVDGISWYILTEGLGCSVASHEKIYRDAPDGKISFSEGEKQLVEFYQKGGKANLQTIKKIYSNVQLRTETIGLIDYLKKKGYLIYLISGAIDSYAEKIAKKVQADGWYANSSLEFDENGNLTKLHYRDSQSRVKLEQLESLVAKLKLDMKSDVYFVGDSEIDVPVFQATGHGIAVYCEDRDLLKATWRNVESLSEIKKVF
jgi:HAD superfamily phosphoserine phosphatase-like hydrolase